MAYTNSKLVDYIKLSPKYTSGRKYALSRITPHCVVGQWTCENIAREFYATGRSASCNYGIGYDGRVALIVEEKNRAWTSNSPDNDGRAITIEVASDTAHPYAVKQAAYNKLVDLCEDICRRYGKKKLLWLGSKEKTLKYSPKSDEMVLSAHRWFAAKACPGDMLYNKFGDIASEVTKRLQPKQEVEDLTREETIKLFDELIEKKLSGKGLPASAWAVNELNEAVKAGITDGTRPQGVARREEVVAMICRAIKKAGGGND